MSAVPIGFDFSGLSLRLEGLDDPFLGRLVSLWSAFQCAPQDSPFLRVKLRFEGGAASYEQPFSPKSMASDMGAGQAVYSMPEGQAELGLEGVAEIRVGRRRVDREFYAMLNLIRASLAWLIPSRGGAMIHAAALVFDGRAFLLAGSEGSGKSSWARIGEESGGHVVSDDLVLVDELAGVPTVLGAPLFSTHPVQARSGRWPLAAILFPEKAAEAGIVPVPSLIARAKLAANLPFVADALGRDPRIDRILERLVSEVPCSGLRFSLSGSFVELLRRWPAPGR